MTLDPLRFIILITVCVTFSYVIGYMVGRVDERQRKQQESALKDN